jgi:hypothetical protein
MDAWGEKPDLGREVISRLLMGPAGTARLLASHYWRFNRAVKVLSLRVASAVKHVEVEGSIVDGEVEQARQKPHQHGPA